jgi:hypothetical protein
MRARILRGHVVVATIAAMLLFLQPASAGVDALVKIIPTGPTFVANCIPFGNNTDFEFTGFIWRNVPAFNLDRGERIAFDLGSLNDVDTRRNIWLAVANKNPDPPQVEGGNVISQDVRATAWVRVVADTQVPSNPRGDTRIGNYELRYRAGQAFSFPGGGLIAGFGSSPPGAYADFGCEQVLVRTDWTDPSGYFYARFCFKPNLYMGALDEAGTCGGTASELGGIVIADVSLGSVDSGSHGTAKVTPGVTGSR